MSLDVPWCETWYLNFSLHDYMFDKYEGWTCPSMSLEAMHDFFTYLVLNLVNIRYWDDPCRENKILAYMVANLIIWYMRRLNLSLDLKHDLWSNLVLYSVKWKVLKCLLSRIWDISLYGCKVDRWEGWIFKHDLWSYLVLYSV